MDAASLALSIGALYNTCRDCYNFFTTIKAAQEESSAHLRELQIQQSILKAWGFHWQIQSEDGNELENLERAGRKQTKLHAYFSRNRFKAEGVFSTLSALADTLSNQEKLIKRYGIDLRPAQAFQSGPQPVSNTMLAIENSSISDVKPVIGELRNRLSILNKFKWALKDKENFKKLITDLKSYSESLYRLCPENAFQSMNIYLTMECLATEESPAGLKRTSKLAALQAEMDGDSSIREGYELLASTATLKALINENRDGGRAEDKVLPKIEEEQSEMRYLGKSLALFKEQVVYVEMRDYRGPPLPLTPEQKEEIQRRRTKARILVPMLRDGNMTPYYSGNSASQIHYDDDDDGNIAPIEQARPTDPQLHALIMNFFHTFQDARMSERVYGLDMAGMIDHTQGEHKGHCSIFYKLPGAIGVQDRLRPAENLMLRAPVTLKSLLGKKTEQGIQATLGARFELARKLVRAVCLLHSSGWLHKNIRAESVMYFPEHDGALQEDKFERKLDINVSKPILMGYIFSRPDDIIVQSKGSLPPSTLTASKATRVDPPNVNVTMTDMWDIPAGISTDTSPRSKRQGNTYGRDKIRTSLRLLQSNQTKKTMISGFTLDYYQHPAKHANPKRIYRHAYDVYSLGILLIEVGLWEQLIDHEGTSLGYDTSSDNDEEDHYERRRWICRTYLDRLRWACGDTYADVVLNCLMLDSSDDEVARASERELCAKIVADLGGCQA